MAKRAPKATDEDKTDAVTAVTPSGDTPSTESGETDPVKAGLAPTLVSMGGGGSNTAPSDDRPTRAEFDELKALLAETRGHVQRIGSQPGIKLW
jgi:hypothetical protein